MAPCLLTDNKEIPAVYCCHSLRCKTVIIAGRQSGKIIRAHAWSVQPWRRANEGAPGLVGLHSPEEQELGLASVMALAGECDDAEKLSRVGLRLPKAPEILRTCTLSHARMGARFRLLMCEKYLELHWLETRAQRHDGVRILGEIVGLRKRWFLYNDDVYYYNSDRLIGAQRRSAEGNGKKIRLCEQAPKLAPNLSCFRWWPSLALGDSTAKRGSGSCTTMVRSWTRHSRSLVGTRTGLR